MKNRFFPRIGPLPCFLFFPFSFSFLSSFRFCSSLPFFVAAPITNNRRLLPAAALLCFFFFLSLAQQKQAAADRAATEADGGASAWPFSGDVWGFFRWQEKAWSLSLNNPLVIPFNFFEFNSNLLIFHIVFLMSFG